MPRLVTRSPATAQRRLNQEKFLEAYASTRNVSAAAKLAAISRRTHYKWLARDKRYAAAAAAALEQAADRLETEARRRAVSGVSEPVFYQGEQVGTIHKYSDLLLIFLLKAARPEKYANRHVVGGKGKHGAMVLEEIVAGGGHAQ